MHMKKMTLLFCLLLSFYATLNAQKSGNPVFPGWYADPEVTIFGDKYWIYPTFSAPYNQQVFMDAFSSPDLVNWTKHSHIIDTVQVKWAKKAMWAPAIVEKDGKYYLFFAANDIQNNGNHGGIGIGIAERPQGPFRDYLGKPLIDQFHNGAQPIDQFVFKDIDKQYYMFYGGWKHCNVSKLNSDFTGFIPFDDGTIFKEITPEGYVEGSVMFIRNGKYYFMWSEGGWTGPDYRVAYAIADSPLGPFERIGIVLQQDGRIANGAGHNSVINVPGTDEWYMVYHRRPLTEKDGNSRMTCIDKMEFDPDGKILPVVMTNEGVDVRPLDKAGSFSGRMNTSQKYIQLFNGENLDGWYTFLKGKGKNSDPDKVFTVKNGNIVISGEEFGCITTDEEFENYKLTVEFKWGERTFAPRADRARDSGILLHSVGEDGASGGIWMHSIESQIIEGGTGDIIIVGDGTDNFSATTTVKPGVLEGACFYDPEGEVKTFVSGRIDWHSRDPQWEDKKGFRGANDVERPVGQWNRIECYAIGNDLLIYVNGKLVNRVCNVKPQKGKIQIQSEGAEIFIRKVDLQRL